MSDTTPKTLGGYSITGTLGAGGMGTVYKAVQGTLQRTVALKVLPPELARNPEYIQRFLREARAAAGLRHDNIVQVYDAGDDQGQYFMAMEFVDGSNLLQFAEKNHPVNEQEGLKMLLQAARGLGAAHSRGLVHRDIKPENLLIGNDGVLRVVDFGLVSDESSTTQLTATGACLGTPMYMSPEQADGEVADARTDVYSLGVTFFRVLTGQPPFTSGTLVNLLYKHKFEAPPDPRTFRPDLSENARNLILRMMSKRRADRPANGQALTELVEGALAGKAVEPPAAGALIAVDKPTVNVTNFEPAATLINPNSPSRVLQQKAKRKPWVLALVTAAVVLLLAVVLFSARGKDVVARAKTLVQQEREREAIAEVTAALKDSPGDETLQKTKSALQNLQTVQGRFAELLKAVQVAADRIRSVRAIDAEDGVKDFEDAYGKLTSKMLQRPFDTRAMFVEGGYEGVEKAAVLLKGDAAELHTNFTGAAEMCERKAARFAEKKLLGIKAFGISSGNAEKVNALKAFAQDFKNLADQVSLLKN